MDRIYLTIPNKCPVCGGDTKIITSDNGIENLICTNLQCSGKLVNRLDHFVSKKGLDIKGLSIKTLEKLVDWGYINDIDDIPKLKEHRDEWIKKDGFGIASVDKILKNIDERLAEAPLSGFIAGLGIPLIGSKVAKQICQEVETWREFRDLINEGFDFSTWNGFGYEMNKALHDFDYSVADNLIKSITFEVVEQTSVTNNSNLENTAFVITGKLQKHKNRQELVDKIEAAGGKVQSAVSSKTNYLINNDINSASSKNKKAKELNIPIITEEDLLRMLS